MSEILFSSVLSGFFMVRVVKGPWMRNPQYLAASIAGSVVATLLLHAVWPEVDGDFMFSSLAAFAGAFGGIVLFDTVLGVA